MLLQLLGDIKSKKLNDVLQYVPYRNLFAVFRICDILVRIRICTSRFTDLDPTLALWLETFKISAKKIFPSFSRLLLFEDTYIMVHR